MCWRTKAMKTPEEIKKALRICVQHDRNKCDECPYDKKCGRKDEGMLQDIIVLIEQLEERIQLMLIQMKGDCGTCKHRLDERKLDDKQLGCRLSPACYECLKKDGREMWEYEGLPEVKGKC